MHAFSIYRPFSSLHAPATSAGSRCCRQQHRVTTTQRSWLVEFDLHSTDKAESSPLFSPSATYPAAADGSQFHLSRRSAVALPPLVIACAAAAAAAAPAPAQASKLGGAVDSAWEALGGGPADLFFPEQFLGTWDVVSTLVKVETPLGEDKLPNPASVRRAREMDLGKPLGYQVAFVRNSGGRVIFDRRFNVASMMAQYYPGSSVDFAGRIAWNPDDPNVLQLRMPSGGLEVRTRVTRRSEVDKAPDSRIETSEYMEQIFDSEGSTRIKASQCFTKYLYRDEATAAADGGPAIVATQVVSDYLTPYDGEAAYLAARNAPVAVYTYRMSFMRRDCSGGNCAGLAAS